MTARARALVAAAVAGALAGLAALAAPRTSLSTAVAWAGPGGGFVGDAVWIALTLGVGVVAATTSRGVGSSFDALRRLRAGSRRGWMARELGRAAGVAIAVGAPAVAVGVAGPLSDPEIEHRSALLAALVLAVPLQVVLAATLFVGILRTPIPVLGRLVATAALLVAAALPPAIAPASPLTLAALSRVSAALGDETAPLVGTLGGLLFAVFVVVAGLLLPGRWRGASTTRKATP